MTSGNILKRLREKAGYTMDEVAMILGVATASIYNWEKGQIMRYPQMLSKLLDIYDASEQVRIHIVILMYGDKKDIEFFDKVMGGS